MNAPPRVLVIILTYNNEDEAVDCVQSVVASQYDNLDVLLIDNASPDGSGSRLPIRLPNVHHIVSTTNGGYTAGNNIGFDWALARGYDFVVVLNDDTEIEPACIARLVAASEETGAAAVAPSIVYYDEPNVIWYAGGVFSATRAIGRHIGENEPIDPRQVRMPVSFVCGCCFLLRVDVLREVGGFDESFFSYVEDVELSVRLARRGHVMLYEPAARVLHKVRRNASPAPWQVRLRDKNRRRLAARHYGMTEKLRFGAWFYPTRLIHTLVHLVNGRWEFARAQLQGAFQSLADQSPPMVGPRPSRGRTTGDSIE